MEAFKYLIGLGLLLGYVNVFSQSKHDANWCFGIAAGINFSNSNNPYSFQTQTNNLEVAASISDSAGNLQLYLTANGDYYKPSSLLNNSNQIIINGDSINTDYTCTNCALFIPSISESDHYILFHIGYYQVSGCPYSACYHLYYTEIRKNTSDKYEVFEKNILLLEEPLVEKLAAVKHANGTDWWIFVQRSCANKFYRLLLTSEGIEGPFEQDIGTFQCNIGGEITFSKQGNKLAIAIGSQYLIDVFSLDRCTGLLFNYTSIQHASSIQSYPYGCEFSPNEKILYVTEGGPAGGSLYQYNLESPNISLSKETVWINNNTNFLVLGQLQLSRSNKIYLASFEGPVPSPPYGHVNQNLGVINHPDSLGTSCDFQPFSFYLGDSARSLVSLPNIPNYNLDPTPIYAADAGTDTVYCNNSSGVMLGVQPVENIIYSWYPSFNLSNTTIAQPTASPMEDTWYYLTTTDTSNSISCNTRADSIFVKVEYCTGINSQHVESFNYKLFPNLISSNNTVF